MQVTVKKTVACSKLGHYPLCLDAIFLAVTEGWNLNMCLPLCEASQRFCHLILQESFTSMELRGVSPSGIFSASSAASLVNLSAISLPAISAWPGVQLNSIVTFWLFRISVTCFISNIADVCDFWVRKEHNLFYIYFSISNLMLSSAFLMAISFP